MCNWVAVAISIASLIFTFLIWVHIKRTWLDPIDRWVDAVKRLHEMILVSINLINKRLDELGADSESLRCKSMNIRRDPSLHKNVVRICPFCKATFKDGEQP